MVNKIILTNAQRLELISYYLLRAKEKPLSAATLDFLQEEAYLGAQELTSAINKRDE
jgi:hypothetical protein